MTLGTTMAVSAMLSSCAPELPPTSSPTPVVAPTPSASTPTESPQEREERLAYEGAEKAYRTFITEYFRIVSSSDRPRVTPTMRKHATGDYLKGYATFIKQRRKARVQSSGPVVVRRVDRVAYSPKRVLLTACEDGSESRIIDQQDRIVGRGEVRTIDLTVRRVDSRWLVSDGDNEMRVKPCAD